MNLAEYQLYVGGEISLTDGKLYRYILGTNGVFVYAKNEFVEACIPVGRMIARPEDQVRGLKLVSPFVRVVEKVSNAALREILFGSRINLPCEVLFYLRWNPFPGGWKFDIPPQWTTRVSAKPREFGDYAPIEVHSHNTMPAFFSEADNKDEVGFRIYAVLGHVDRSVVDIKVRVSIYGHRAIIPYQTIFEPYAGVRDAQG